MKNFSIVAVLMAIAFFATSCASTKTAEEKFAERKITELQDSISGVHAQEAVSKGHFVILANRISFSPSGRVYNNPREETNFLYVLGEEGVVQFAFENGFPGANGLGGITCKGRISAPSVTIDKRGNTRIAYSLYGDRTSATVNIVLYKNSDDAQALVSGNFGIGSLTIYGKLKPYNIE